MKSRILVEACTGSLSDSIKASEAGADRIELNSALETGGLSPSPGVLSLAIDSVDIPVIAMVRPHPGGFCYSAKEKTAMLRDTEFFLSRGVAGIAVGALHEDTEVDTAFVSQLRKLTGESQLVFHRAFDLLTDLPEGVSILADLGVDRILTSGGSRTAWEGRNTLRNIIKRFGKQIEILPGSGIGSYNAAALVDFTCCSQLHGSFSRTITYPASAAAVLPKEGKEICVSEIKKTIQLFQ